MSPHVRSRVALPEKPGKISLVFIVGRAVLYCDGCGLAVWPYSTDHSKTVLYGTYSTGSAFVLPTQSTIKYYILYLGCESYQFTCDNGDCVPSDYECDDIDDCGDNSDEQGCGSGMFVYSIICHTLTVSTPPYTV